MINYRDTTKMNLRAIFFPGAKLPPWNNKAVTTKLRFRNNVISE